MTAEEFLEATYTDEYKNISPDKLNVYLNPYALSLAYAATDAIYDINLRDINKWVGEDDERYNPDGMTSPFKRMNALFSAILGEEIEVFKAATQNGEPIVSGGVEVKPIVNEHNKYVGKKDETITYSYTVPEGVEIYSYFPAFYSRAIKLSSSTMKIADGTTSLDSCNARIVHLGHTEGTEYKLTVTINNTTDGGQFYTMVDESYIYYVDTEALEDAVSRIKKEQLVIDENYKDDDIRGTIYTSKANKTVLTTIPYDKGWEVYVDGKRVETREAVDALIAFEIENIGEHTVRFVYRSMPIKAGLIISLTSLAGFILIIIFEDKLKKLAIVNAIFVVEEPTEDEIILNNKKK